MTQKIIFIASLEHSGSTLLDLILGGHPRFVGLGEIFLLLKPGTRRLDRTDKEFCSCGTTIDACEFWGPVSAQLKEHRALDVPAKYEIVLKAFDQMFGPDCTLVDSSKNLAALQALKKVPDTEIKVLYLIRDVRSWIVSMRDARKRRGDFALKDLFKKYGRSAGLRYIARTALFFCQRWYFSNKKLKGFLEQANLPSFQLGYEELSLYPEYLSRAICDFVDVEPNDTMLSLSDSGSHSVLGNRMRSQKEKRQRIFYDNRWFYRNDWLLPAVLFPHVMKYNREQVYRNRPGQLWSK